MKKNKENGTDFKVLSRLVNKAQSCHAGDVSLKLRLTLIIDKEVSKRIYWRCCLRILVGFQVMLATV